MLTLKSLTFSGIGRFVEEQTVTFDNLPPLVQVEGINNNTGGSSGAAKSTIFKAIDYLLGINNLPNSVLQSRLTKETLNVVGIFNYDGVPLKIQRGKKFLIDLNGEVTTGNAKLTEEKLDQILGMPRDLFRKILHKRQGEGGFFLDMSPGDVHKFLTNCLGLENELKKVTVIDTTLAELTKTQAQLQSDLIQADSGLNATLEALKVLYAPKCSVDEAVVANLHQAYVSSQAVLEQLRKSYKDETLKLELERPVLTTANFDRTLIIALEAENIQIQSGIAALENADRERQRAVQLKIFELEQAEKDRQRTALQKIAELESLEKDRQRALQQKISELSASVYTLKAKSTLGARAMLDAQSAAQELSRVREAICPTCEQGWATDTAKAKEAQLVEKLKGYKELVVEGKKADLAVIELEKTIATLKLEATPQTVECSDLRLKAAARVIDYGSLKSEALPKPLEDAALKAKFAYNNSMLSNIRAAEQDFHRNHNEGNQALLREFVNKQNLLRAQQDSGLSLIQDQYSNAQSAYVSAANEWKGYAEALTKHEASLKELYARENTFTRNSGYAKISLGDVEEKLELLNEAKKAIKSYLSASFDDALESIGDTATRLARGIPNMSTATIQLEGMKETKEGKVKEEINALIHMDGELGIPIKSLSGGEASSTDLAIDLAVEQFIEERTGKGINIKILDEPFTGLDFECSSNALEMLKNCNIGKTILIVDHNPVLKDQIENRITVVRTGNTSRVEQ